MEEEGSYLLLLSVSDIHSITDINRAATHSLVTSRIDLEHPVIKVPGPSPHLCHRTSHHTVGQGVALTLSLLSLTLGGHHACHVLTLTLYHANLLSLPSVCSWRHLFSIGHHVLLLGRYIPVRYTAYHSICIHCLSLHTHAP